MFEKEKLQILNNQLEKLGLSMEQEDVRDFFYAQRNVRKNSYVDEKTGKHYTYSGFVQPRIEKLLPSDFENSGYIYEQGSSLMDWYLSEIKDGGTFQLFENCVGHKQGHSIPLYEAELSLNSGSVFRDKNGDMFGFDSMNEYLLLLKINHFLSRLLAKDSREKKQVDKGFVMTLPVSTMVDERIARLMDFEYEQMKDTVPSMALDFRALTFQKARKKDCFLKINDNGEFEYSLNGETVVGTEDEVFDKLFNAPDKKDSMMKWSVDGVHYASSHNKVVMSKDPSKLEEFWENHKKLSTIGNDQENVTDYLMVKDLDTGAYHIKTPVYKIEDPDQKKKVATFQKNLVKNWGDVLSEKCRNARKSITEIKTACSDYCLMLPYPLVLNSRVYENMNEEEFEKIKYILDFEMKNMRNLCQENDSNSERE